MMNKTLVEGRHGTGYRHSSIPRFFRPKKSDLIFKSGQEPLPFDWTRGYDVEKELATILGVPNFKLPVKDQGTSFSCGGQASSTYISVLVALLNNTFTERSARDIYSHVYYLGGGTTSDRLSKLLMSRGVARESLVSSYNNGQPPDESFMVRKQDTPDVLQDALQAQEDLEVSIDLTDIDKIAQSIRDGHGARIAFQGENNGTWRSVNPRPPNLNAGDLWGHYVYFGKAMMMNGQKTIWLLNSWGVGNGQSGWQYWTEDYVKSGALKDAVEMVKKSKLVPQTQQTLLTQLLSACQKVVPLMMKLIQMLQPNVG